MRFALALLLVVYGTNVSALSVRVNRAGPIAADEVSAHLRRLDSDEPARQIPLRVGETTALDLPPAMWEISITSDDVWAAPVYVSSDSETVTLELWPKGQLIGTVGSGPVSGELVLHFSSEATSGVSTCALDERKWRCAVPAGVFDVRLALPGYATEFRWGVEVPAGTALDLKAIDFTAGSSLDGFVEAARGATIADVRSAEVVAAIGAKTFKAKPNARGFFQIKGLAPGEYTVRASAKELASDARTVQIVGHTNATLKQPLVIAKPATITVTAVPQLDPHNQRWQVELSKRRDGEQWLDIVATSDMSGDGTWTRSGVPPGEYVVTMQQQDGSQWKAEPVTILSDDVSLHVVLLGERVAGTVMLGDEPLAATLRFGGERGQTLVASDDGRFSGTVAPLGDEPVAIHVTADAANLRRTLKLAGKTNGDGVRRFEIRLPATVVSGIVRNEDGSPANGAIVTIDSLRGDDFEQTYAGEDGSFELAGLDAGAYRLSAQSFLTRSDIVEVMLENKASRSFELTLRPEIAIQGQVRTGTIPVAGASVIAIPRGVRIHTGPQATSDANGRFALQLPPGTETYDIAVVPRGFYVSIGRVTAVPERILRAEVAQDGGTLRADAPAGQYLRLRRGDAEFPFELLARRSDGVVEISKERQSLAITNLEPGMYSVCGAMNCMPAYVPRLGTASVSLR